MQMSAELFRAQLAEYARLSPEERQRRREAAEQERVVAIACHACGDAGWVHPRRADGTVESARVVPCRCGQDARQVEARQQQYDRAGMAPAPVDLLSLFRVNAANRAAFSAALCLADGQADHQWLIICGQTGCGKSHLARAIAQRWLAQGQSVRYCYVPGLLGRLRAAMDRPAVGPSGLATARSGPEMPNASSQVPHTPLSPDSIIADLVAVDLCVLDDVGGHGATEWQWAQIEAIVGGRYDAIQAGQQRAMVLTTNRQMDREFPGPLYSRLCDVRVSQIEINRDEDRRPRA